jgi:pfkB family carbohydrate kinase
LSSEERFDYTAIGHVTIDVLADGSRRAGGAAFYSALQAARLGQRTRLITQGVPAEIEALLEPYRDAFALEIIPAPQTTTLDTRGEGSERTQRLLAWAGPIATEPLVSTGILHLAPVARETPPRWLGASTFLGLTPQGLVRAWDDEGGAISSVAPPRCSLALAARCDALVISADERASCARLIDSATEAGAVVVVTAGGQPNTILARGGHELALAVPPIERARDDLGAGDVFAAALFVALAEGRRVEDASAFANAAAAVRIEGVGADAIGGRGAVEARRAGAAS